MKLTKKDIGYLKDTLHESESGIRQIQEAIINRNTKLTYHNKENTYFEAQKEVIISQKKAIELLGRESFLSGIARSAFHWSAVRHINDNEYIYFDSSKFFKG